MLRMKYPSHPGKLVKISLEELNIPVAAAAKALGVTRQHLHNIISGKSAVTAEMAVRLEKGIGSTADTWLRMQASYDLSLVLNRDEQPHVERLEPREPRQAAE
jgi:addiction module HigA family antidote